MSIAETVAFVNSNLSEPLDNLINRRFDAISEQQGGADNILITDIAMFAEQGFMSDDDMCIVISGIPLLRKHRLAFERFYRHVIKRDINLGIILSNLFDIDLTKDSNSLADVALPLKNKLELLKTDRLLQDILNNTNNSRRNFLLGASFYVTKSANLKYRDYSDEQIKLGEMRGVKYE